MKFFAILFLDYRLMHIFGFEINRRRGNEILVQAYNFLRRA